MRIPLAVALALLAGAASAQDSGKTGRISSGYGGELQGFDYPFPVETMEFTSQGLALRMAYMDVAPTGDANGRTVVLLHGKNFCAATWEGAIRSLTGAGYRVVAPDQIGFCKSTKPKGYQFSLGQLAANTNALLEKLGITRADITGHSMGGMLAMRYALAYPQATGRLVLVNPIGLEDWQAKGVPYQTIDEAYAGEMKTDAASIKAYQQKFYYNGDWKPDYDRWVDMLAGMYAGPDKAIVAWNQAQTSDMVFTQPVVHEFSKIEAPTTLMIGQRDRTAPGANRAPEAVAATLGDYPKLGKAVSTLIPDARLVEFPELGHSPQVEAPAEFEKALLDALR